MCVVMLCMCSGCKVDLRDNCKSYTRRSNQCQVMQNDAECGGERDLHWYAQLTLKLGCGTHLVNFFMLSDFF